MLSCRNTAIDKTLDPQNAYEFRLTSDTAGVCVPFSNVTYNYGTGELAADPNDPVAARMANGSFRNIASRTVMAQYGVRNIDAWNESALMSW